MSSRSFSWLASSGGAWSLPSNWDDLTDGVDPSLLAPGPQDSVTVTGQTGGLTTAILGAGSALSADFTANVSLSGSFAFGAFSLGTDDNGGLLSIGAAASVNAGSAVVASGSLLASGAGAALSISGALSLGGGGTANLDATSGGRIQAGTLTLGSSSASVYVDPASAIEVGGTGGALPGALTIDAGAELSGAGDANAYGPVVNNGTISASGGNLLVGSVTGTGLLSIDAASELTLNGSTGLGQSVLFAASGGTLALATEFDGPHGTITGFTLGDAIDILGSQISSAGYFPLGKDLGLLSLYYGDLVAVTLTLLGNYGNDIFLTAGDGALGTLITVSPESDGGGTVSGGTSNPDVYQWTPATGGAWNSAQNWEDVTTGADPARVAPGKNNLVSIACAQQGSFSVISGPADAAQLAVTGDLAMTGTYALGSLVLGTTANYGTIGNLDLLPQVRMTAQSAAIVDGELSLNGGASLVVAGTLAMGGGQSGVGLPVTALALSSGATLTCAGLTLGGGSGDTITTDPTGVLEVGGAGGARAGAVTVDAGAVLSGNGSVNPFGALVDNGTITAAGGVLALGTVTGSGSLTIGGNAGLLLNASSAVPVVFTGADGTLAVADELVSASGTITGFTDGDAIDIQGDPITSVAVGKFVGGVTLTLYYNTTPVAHFTLAGVYTGDRFFLAPDGGFGTDVLVDSANGGGGGGGQGNTDLLSWAQPVSGYWNKAANWFDLTTNAAASAPPGTLNAVQVVGPGGFAFQTIGGPAVSASMAFYGNTYVSGAWSTGTLTVGGVPFGGSETTGTMEVGANSGATAGNTEVLDGLILVAGASASLTVTGTLTLGSGGPDAQGPLAELSATGGGDVSLGGLSLGGGAGDQLLTDAFSSIEIGTLGDAQAGAVVLDAGFSASGNGSINPLGLLVDNGTLTAEGGTLQLGNVTGSRTLAIGAAATLEVLGTDACPVDMAGQGASLAIGAATESLGAPVSGFVQGDQIVIENGIVGAVAYMPGAGGVGTLTLYNGGAVAGTLLLAGDYSGDSFTVQPDGAGALIGVQAGAGGPSQGTGTPDDYSWIGGTGGNWNMAANWTDVSAGQTPAQVAPGINDLVTVQGGENAYTSIDGPANAASLTLLGEVALIGQYATGALAVGQGGATGILALGGGASLQAGQAAVAGGIVAQGGSLTSTGTLALEGGVLIAGGGGVVQVGGLVLSGSGDDVTVDASSMLEVGTAGGAAAGTLTVDAGAVLAGGGVVDPAGQIAVAGTITALAGAAALALGDVSGAGTLLVGVGATLELLGSAAASLLVDFAGPGTLSVAGALPAAAIAGFGDGSVIDLPISGITSASYAVTEPNVGILTLDAGDVAVGALTLVGVGLGQAFSVAGIPGGTILTTTTVPYGGGGSNVRNEGPQSGSGQPGIISDFAFWQYLPVLVQQTLAAFQEDVGGTSYVWSSPDGSYFGPYQPGYANIAVITDPPDSITGNTVALPPGYDALLAQGDVPLKLTDGAGNHVLLMGNSANDTIVGNGPDDTLVGGVGANSVIYAAEAATVLGGGNDTIVTTGHGACSVTTAANGRSIVFAGPSSGNVINLSGSDTFIGAGGNGALDTVTAAGAATIFAPSMGLMNFYGGGGVDLVVGSTGTVRMFGGGGNGSVLWCGPAADVIYEGGGGSAAVIGGSGELFAQGGAGAMTVYGGTGNTVINGTPGPSEFVLGYGASTVTAASGNLVWLAGSANDSLVATGGNATVWGANSTGNNVFQAGDGPCTMSGGLGNDTFLGGSGSALLLSGGGADVFSFTNGLAGGAVTVSGFNTAADQIDLHGYSGYANSLVGGNEVLSLSDGTTVTLAGVGSLNGVVIQTL